MRLVNPAMRRARIARRRGENGDRRGKAASVQSCAPKLLRTGSPWPGQPMAGALWAKVASDARNWVSSLLVSFIGRASVSGWLMMRSPTKAMPRASST